MDGGKVAREVRLQYWSGIIQARKRSGQTIWEYCGENGINEKSCYWQRKLRERHRNVVQLTCRLVATIQQIPRLQMSGYMLNQGQELDWQQEMVI